MRASLKRRLEALENVNRDPLEAVEREVALYREAAAAVRQELGGCAPIDQPPVDLANLTTTQRRDIQRSIEDNRRAAAFLQSLNVDVDHQTKGGVR